MPEIIYSAERFHGSWGHLNTDRAGLRVSWQEIIWASISVGKLGITDLFGHGRFSASEMLFKTHLLFANLRQTRWGAISRTSLYDSLDSTEKGAVSYFVGMAMAKLIAWRFLGVVWLVHLEKMRRHRVVRLMGSSRPDLIGAMWNGNWVVVEAKGRTNGYSLDAIAKAKNQTRQVKEISGTPPALKVATESFFDHGALSLHCADPEDYDPGAVSFDIEPAAYLQTYYEPFLALAEQGDLTKVEVGQRKYICCPDPQSGVTIGLDEFVYRLARERQLSFETLARVAKEQVGAPPVEGAEFQAFPDGVIVGVDGRWADERMCLAPEKRNDNGK